jgi:hypothetical protein
MLNKTFYLLLVTGCWLKIGPAGLEERPVGIADCGIRNAE